jgi:hypothetical protein
LNRGEERGQHIKASQVEQSSDGQTPEEADASEGKTADRAYIISARNRYRGASGRLNQLHEGRRYTHMASKSKPVKASKKSTKKLEKKKVVNSVNMLSRSPWP